MGMQFNPMYQPVTTTTIKADGDLNVSPYDVEAYDGRFDTVEADEFVGGVGNFSSLVMPTLGYNNYDTYSFLTMTSGTTNSTFTLFSSPFPISGTISLKTDTTRGAQAVIIGKNGTTKYNITTTQTEYTVTDAYTITVEAIISISSQPHTITYGVPVLT